MPNTNKGFTLIELAIVIVIVGLLVAGIAGSTKLIEQAKLRTVITDLDGLRIAYLNFKGKYNALPGDMSTASAFFPNCHQTASLCNGNGDDIIGWTNDDSLIDESVRGLRHMNLAGLISNGGGVQIPNSYQNRTSWNETDSGHFYKGSLDNGFSIHGGANISPDVNTMWFSMPVVFTDYRPAIYMTSGASKSSTDTPQYALHGSITASQAFELDRKIDDGFFSGGNAIGATTGNFVAITGQGTDVCATGDVYSIQSTSKGCIILNVVD